ncbi:MAG: two-component system chemotaxis response regulator CheY [Alteromonadaceae bacterium]|jgi:two-component system chemotaxis response regulator CheY
MKSLNIQVVDDSPLTVKKITQMLENLGHKVVKVSATGKSAVFDYQYTKPDLVTMDITMPDMDGITATRRIIELDKKARIVMVTSHSQKQMIMDSISAGALGYVMKPVDVDKLQATIEKAYARTLKK